MVISREIIYRGLQKGLLSTWELAKILMPTVFIITLLRTSGGLESVASFFAPLMQYLGLPGEAAIIIFSGYFINLYAAIGGMVTLELATNEMLIIAVMLGFCHSLLLELAVSKKAGAPISYILPLRAGASILAGFVLGGLL